MLVPFKKVLNIPHIKLHTVNYIPFLRLISFIFAYLILLLDRISLYSKTDLELTM